MRSLPVISVVTTWIQVRGISSGSWNILLTGLSALLLPLWSHFLAWKQNEKVKVKVAQSVCFFATSRTIQSMEFSRPEYWSGQPFPSPEDLPNSGIKPRSPALQQILYQLSHKGSTRILEWVAYTFSRGSSQPGNWTGASCIAGRFFTNWAIREAPRHTRKILL